MTQRDPEGTSVPPDTGGTGARDEEQEGEERIVVRDRRRIDPNGTSPRAGTGSASGPGDTDRPGADRPGDAAPAGKAGAAGQADSAGTAGADKAGTGKASTEKVGADKAGADKAGAGTAGGAPQAGRADKGAGPDEGSVTALRAELAERTRDLKRVVAEYANYRRRVERDRTVAAEQATGAVLASLLPVLDDLDRAREHGDLVGPFGAVAEQLTSILSKAGLTPYGEVGDPFDPMHHEAVAHQLSADVTEPTCVMVMRHGYRHGDRMLRPAMVAVAEPDPDAAAQPADAATEPHQPAEPDLSAEPDRPAESDQLAGSDQPAEPERPAEPAANADADEAAPAGSESTAGSTGTAGPDGGATESA